MKDNKPPGLHGSPGLTVVTTFTELIGESGFIPFGILEEKVKAKLLPYLKDGRTRSLKKAISVLDRYGVIDTTLSKYGEPAYRIARRVDTDQFRFDYLYLLSFINDIAGTVEGSQASFDPLLFIEDHVFKWLLEDPSTINENNPLWIEENEVLAHIFHIGTDEKTPLIHRKMDLYVSFGNFWEGGFRGYFSQPPLSRMHVLFCRIEEEFERIIGDYLEWDKRNGNIEGNREDMSKSGARNLVYSKLIHWTSMAMTAWIGLKTKKYTLEDYNTGPIPIKEFTLSNRGEYKHPEKIMEKFQVVQNKN